MTGLVVPSDVFVELRPPEANEEVASGSEDSLMAEIVVGVPDKGEALFGIRDKLRAAVMIFPEELSVHDEVTRGLADELSVLLVREV